MAHRLKYLPLRIAAKLCAATFFLAATLTAYASASQVGRDRAARARLHAAVEGIEALRRKVGHVPSNQELEYNAVRGLENAIYTRLTDNPTRLRSLGASKDSDYLLALWRGEHHDHFYSWNGEDDCDSGAWYLALLFSAPVGLLSVLLGRLAIARRRESAKQ